jgi:hypothetical protein
VGWTADNEWIQYTANVDSTAAYAVNLRFASLNPGSKVRIQINGADVTSAITLPATGGYQTWSTYTMNDIILNKGRQKIKVLFEKGGANFGYLSFTLQKKTEDVSLIGLSAQTFGQTELIYFNCNKSITDSTLKSTGFTCLVNGSNISISSIKLNPENNSQIIIGLSQHISDIDEIKLSYTVGTVSAFDGTLLQSFTDLIVKNNLPVFTKVPGKVEAEAFSFNQGLAVEKTSDAGGGSNIGYTNTGDYLDYRIRVMKSARYLIEMRIACLNAAGRVEIQQISTSGTVLNAVQLNVPVTGGWQVWQTVGTNINLTEGVCTLRIKILQPEFNINWFNITESGVGIEERESPVFSLYPNPACDQLSILIPGSHNVKKIFTLISVSGIPAKKTEVSDMEELKTIFVGDLPKGMYIVKMEMGNKVYHRKLVIQ